jgi:acetoin utilization protein AcuB
MTNETTLTVDEFTTPYVVTIDHGASLDEALSLMQENKIRHLPVMNKGELIGILSERDVLANMGKSWTSMCRVNDIMTLDSLVVHLNDGLGEVAYQLSFHKVGSAIVLDEDDKLYGIFTTTDALNALVELMFPKAKELSDFKNLDV